MPVTYVQVKHKYQVTIPAALRKRLNLHEGDMLEVREQDGVLVLVPQAVSQRPAVQPRSPLLAMIGANKGSNLYKSAQDADNFIRKLRDEWN
jgi:AbrB family looped-hinge helix DNA binding protein